MVSPIRLPLSLIRLPLRAKKNVWVSLDCVAYSGLVRMRRACRLVRTSRWWDGHGNSCRDEHENSCWGDGHGNLWWDGHGNSCRDGHGNSCRGDGHGNLCRCPRLGGKRETLVVVAVEGADKLRSVVVVAVEGAVKLRWTQE